MVHKTFASISLRPQKHVHEIKQRPQVSICIWN